MKVAKIKSLILFITTVVSANAQQFEKIVTGPVVETPSGSRACVWADFNNDNLLDLFISNGTSGGENNMLYINNGDETFSFVPGDATSDNTPSDGACAADFNNDGWIDLAVANWYNINNLLYINEETVGIDLVQIDTGIVTNNTGYSETASWGDYDNDGFIDLYVTNSAGPKRNYLYKNLGGGAFVKILGIEPATDAFWSRSVHWVDIDLDLDLDLFVTNEGAQKNNMYLNQGNGVFTSLLNDPLVADNFDSFTSSWSDIDNDGDFDVFIGNYQTPNQLFLNDGVGNFSLSTGPWDAINDCTFSSSFADYDNDGFKDLYVTNGFCSPDVKNTLYHNDGNGSFTQIFSEPVAIDSGSAYGCAWGDYNNDGNLDLVVANWQNETQTNALYKNLGNGNHWIKIHLEGIVSNRSAVGAIVRCYATINGVPQWQTDQITTQSGYCSQNSMVAHFGLGASNTVDSLVVLWPSGISDTLTNILGDHFYDLKEGGQLGSASLPKMDELDHGLYLYPNPNNGKILNICFNPELNFSGQIDLIRQDGSVVKQMIITDWSQGTIELKEFATELQSGMYFLRINFEEGAISRPLRLK